jgi:hypothetical protein
LPVAPLRVIWDTEDDPEGNVAHISEHGLNVEDVESAIAEPIRRGKSRTSGLPAPWGYTTDGTFIIVIYEQVDEDTIRVTTAYEVPEL